jgi:maltose O-acetyltransferase
MKRMAGYVALQAAKSSGVIGPGCRFGPNGEILNIHGARNRVRIGANSFVDGSLQVFAHEGRIDIGEWFYLGPRSTIWSSSPGGVKIGNRVLVSFDVHIHDTNSHPMDPVARFGQTEDIFLRGHPRTDPGISAAPVVIGDDVWIGQGAVIMKGVTIGDRAIIGARSFVRENVPADALIRS